MEEQKINAIRIDAPLKASTFEFICVRIISKLKSFIGLVVYRTGYAFYNFFAKFEDIMNIMSSYNEKALVLGNFNFNLESILDKKAQKLKNNFYIHDFKSWVAKSYHVAGWM